VHARAHVARDRTRCRAARHARGHGLVLLHTRVCYTHTSPTSTRASTTSTATYLFAHTPQRTDKRWRSRRRSRNLARGREAGAGAEEARGTLSEASRATETLSCFASVFCLGYGDIRDMRLSRSRRLSVPRVRYKLGETCLRRSEMSLEGFGSAVAQLLVQIVMYVYLSATPLKGG
jgi:hypothetical protein